MYLCMDCDYEFEKPGATMATDGIRGLEKPFYVDCCPRCRGEHYTELFRAGECARDEC